MPVTTQTDPLTQAFNQIVPAPQVPVEDLLQCTSAVGHTLTDSGVSETIRAGLRHALASAVGLRSPSDRRGNMVETVVNVAGDTIDTYRHEPACPSLPSLARIGARAVLGARPWATLTVPDRERGSSYGDISTLGAIPYTDGMLAESRGIDTRSSSVQYGIREPQAEVSASPGPLSLTATQPNGGRSARLSQFGRILWDRHKHTRLAELHSAGCVYYDIKEHCVCFGYGNAPQAIWGALSASLQVYEFFRNHHLEIASTRNQIGQALASELSLITGDPSLQHDISTQKALETIWEMWIVHHRRGVLLNDNLLACHPSLWDVPEIIWTAPSRMWSV
jgi:hypothetical protein